MKKEAEKVALEPEGRTPACFDRRWQVSSHALSPLTDKTLAFILDAAVAE